MATEAELTVQELGRLRRSSGAGDRDRLLRLRRRAVSDGDFEDEDDPGLWDKIKQYWRAKTDSETEEARQGLNEAVTAALPEKLSAWEAVKKKRARMRQIDRILED